MRPEVPYKSPEFRVRRGEESGVHVLAVRGDLDLATAPALSAEIERLYVESLEKPVIVDLCAASFVDSTGLQVVLRAQRRFAQQGRPFALAAPTGGQLHRLLEITGTDGLVRRCPDRMIAISTVLHAVPALHRPEGERQSSWSDRLFPL